MVVTYILIISYYEQDSIILKQLQHCEFVPGADDENVKGRIDPEGPQDVAFSVSGTEIGEETVQPFELLRETFATAITLFELIPFAGNL